MTKMAMFEALYALVNDTCALDNKAELLDGISHEMELLNRKATSAKQTPTKQQLANIELRKRVLAAMTPNVPMTVSDILAVLGDETVTNQRLTHLLTAMKEENLVGREVVKRKAYYTLNETA